MKFTRLPLLCLLLTVGGLVGAIEVPILTVNDSINPGTGDYLTTGIQNAEKAKAPFVVIQMDTPGGLLSTTRQIVQQMLNAKIPVVVFVGPRGARAGSAGALITFASDVAIMAPGTNIGAAHPVSATGGNAGSDSTMEKKIANDTAAFAESLARARGRNTEWAIKAVKDSASISVENALKQGVIDFQAEDLSDALKKISGFTLKAPKQAITSIAPGDYVAKVSPPSVKQKLVSFFSDPSLAYLIMTLGGLCIWIELSHPGLIFPGVLGAICVILSLVSFQMMPINYGALVLIFLGMAMLIAELFLPTFGIVGIGGLVCFVLGSLFLMDTNVPEFQLSLGLILPTAAVLATAAFAIGALVLKTRRTKPHSGMEALLGVTATVRETVTPKSGKVFVHGEIWNAISTEEAPIEINESVTVIEVREMVLVVRRS